MPLIFLAPVRYASQSQGGGGSGGDPEVSGATVTTYDYYWPNTSVLLHADAADGATILTDEGGATWTASSAIVSKTQKKFGKGALYFSGANSSHFDAPASAAAAPGTGDFTMECWIYMLNLNGGAGASSNSRMTICDNRAAADASGWTWTIPYGGKSLDFYNGPAGVTHSMEYHFNPNTWYHVAVVRASGVLYQFVNGVCIGARNGQTQSLGTSMPLRLGANQSSVDNFGFYGYIDDFRFSKVARYAPTSSITAKFDNTDPFFGNVFSLMNFDGADASNTFTDSASLPLKWSVAAGTPTLSATQSKFGGTSLRLNGSSAISSTAPGRDIGTGDFTIEMWFRLDSLGAYTNLVDGVSSNMVSVWLVGSSSPVLRLWLAGANSYDFGATNIVANTWYHVAVCRKNGTVYGFVNGVLIGSVANATNNITSQGIRIGSQFNGTYWTSGYIDDFRLTAGVARYTSNFAVAARLNQYSDTAAQFSSSDRYWSKVSMLLHFDGTDGSTSIVDEKGNKITAVSSCNISTANSKFGGSSGLFAGGYATTGVTSGFTFGTGDFTIELWMKSTVNSIGGGASRTMLSALGNVDGYQNQLYLQVGTGIPIYGNTGSTFVSGTTSVTDGNWHHIAVCRYGTALYMIVDGVIQGKSTSSVNITGNQYVIGAFDTSNNGLFQGNIDELRITKGFARYVTPVNAFAALSSDLTEPASPNLLCSMSIKGQDGMAYSPILDKASNLDLTPVAAVGQGTFNPYSNRWCAYFDGVSYLAGDSSNIFNFGTNDYTVDLWVNIPAYVANGSADGMFILDSRGTTDITMHSFVLMILNTGQVRIMSKASNYVFTSVGTVPLNRWVHLAFARQSGVVKFYVDGFLDSSGADTVNWSLPGTKIVNVGYRRYNSANANNYFLGKIHGLRVLRGQYLYPREFALPTAPQTASYPTSMQLFTTGAIQRDTQLGQVLDTVGNPQALANTPFNQSINYTPSVVTSHSAFFDGADASVVTCPSSTDFTFGTGDFTVEAFVNFRGYAKSPNYAVLFDTRASNGSGGFCLIAAPSNVVSAGDGTTLISSSANALPIGKWVHVAAVRVSGVLTIYVDGVNVASGAHTVNYTSVAPYVRLGNSFDTYPLIGHLSNVRVVKGTAVYTSNFTTPVVPLAAVAGTSLLTLQMSTTQPLILDIAKKNVMSRAGNVKVVAFGTIASAVGTEGGSIYLEGNGAHVSIPNTNLQIGSGDFTIEGWIFPTVAAASFARRIIALGRNGVAGNLSLVLINTGVLRIDIGTSTSYTGSTNIPIGAWSHFAISRTGTVLKLFVNGVQNNSVTNSTALSFTETAILGYDPTVGSGSEFIGNISDLRVVIGTGLYSGAFAMPTAPLSVVANTKLLVAASNGQVYDNSQRATIKLKNTAVIDVLNSRTGKCISLPTSGSNGAYLEIDEVPSFGTSDYSMEFWVKPSSIANLVLLDQWLGSIGNYTTGQFQMLTNGSGFLSVYVATGSSSYVNYVGNIALTANEWNFVQMVRQNGIVQLLVNGIACYSNTSTEKVGIDGKPIMFGVESKSVPTTSFVGYVEGIKLFGAGNQNADKWSYGLPYTPFQVPAALGDLQTTDAYWKDVSAALVPFEGLQTPNSQPITLVGNGVISQDVFKYGSTSLYCPGGGNHGASLHLEDTLANPDGDFTFECWAYPTSFGSNNNGVYVNGSLSTNYNYYIYCGPTSGQIGVYWVNSAGTSDNLASSTSLALNVWSHIAFVRKGSTYSLYVNGVRVATKTSSITTLRTPGGPACIGYYPDGITNWKGYIDDLSIVNYAKYVNPYVSVPSRSITSDAVDQNPDYEKNWWATVLHMRMEDLSDSSKMNHVYASNLGAVLTSVQSKFGTNSLDTTNGGIQFNDGPEWNFHGDFTVEAWVYPTTLGGGTQHYGIFSQGESGSNTQLFVLEMNSGTLRLLIRPSSTLVDIGSTSQLTVGQWNHVAVTRYNNKFMVFLNGVLHESAYYSGSIGDSTYPAYVGQRSSLYQPFPGYISELRVLNGVALYKDSFSAAALTQPKSSQITDLNQGSVQLLMHMNGADNGTTFTDDLGHTTAVVGSGAVTSVTQSKFGGSSAKFVTGSWINVTNSPEFSMDKGNITFEAWVYPTSYGALNGIMSNRRYGQTEGWFLFLTASGNLALGGMINNSWYSTSPTFVTSSNTCPLNQWSHVALVKDGNVFRLCVNGVVTTSAAVTVPPAYVLAADLAIGEIGSNVQQGPFQGYIDEVRVSQVARYTSAYQVPVGPFLRNGLAASIDPYWKYVTFLTHFEGVHNGVIITDEKGHVASQVTNFVTSTAKFKVGIASGFVTSVTNVYSGAQFPASNDFVMDGDFTIEAWVYATSTAQWDTYGGPTILSFSSGGGAASIQSIVLALEANTGKLKFGGSGNNSFDTTLQATVPFATNTWHHVAVTRRNGVAYLFQDGVLVATDTTSASVVGNATWTLNIGCQNYIDSQRPWKGYIDEVRITKGVARYTGNFTPPAYTLPATN